ncbi:MAG: transposase [Bacteroidota bacterium]
MRFVIVAHLTSPLKARIGTLRYEHASSIFSTSGFRYQPHGWKQKERFVVLRRKLPKEEPRSQTTLFTLDRYAYSVVVTNLDLEPYNVFQFYQDRSAMERIVRTLKEDYPFGKAPTNSFTANALYAELSLLAYNLMTWFKQLCLPDDWQSFTLPTIRHRLLMMPGEFVRSKNIPTLRFPRNSLYQDTFYYAQDRIKKLTPLV